MELTEYLKQYKKAAIAFSGGVDSAYLLYAAAASGIDVTAYFVKTAFQPQFELDDARRLAKELNIRFKVIELDILSDAQVVSNPENRCYYCKKRIFTAISQAATSDGFDTIFDGTNASDSADDRPGMKALAELKILSPLRECGLTKDAIRQLSKEAGLFTWDKAAYACLATRIRTGEKITQDTLTKIEKAENMLYEMGFYDLRVRVSKNNATLQFVKEQQKKAQKNKAEIIRNLSGFFDNIHIDEKAR